MNAADEADQLVPGLAVCVAVFACVNRSQLPFVLAGKRLDSVRQVDDESLQIVRRTLRSLGLPEIGAKVQILHAKTILFIYGSVELLRARKIVELR